jgi:hypothetical protein
MPLSFGITFTRTSGSEKRDANPNRRGPGPRGASCCYLIGASQRSMQLRSSSMSIGLVM